MKEPADKAPEGVVEPTVEEKAEAAVKAAKEKLDAFRAARDAKTKPTRDADLAKALELRLSCEMTIAEHEDAHGADNIRWVMFEGLGVVILKRPSQVTYIKYRDKKKDDYLTNWAYAVPHILHPSKDVVEKEWLAKFPFKLDELCGALAQLVGVQVEDALAK